MVIGPATLQAGKIVVGKIAEQVAIQAAAELLLRRIMGGSRGTTTGHQNPVDDLEVSAMMQMVSGQAGGIVAPVKRKKSKYNRLVGKHMRALTKARNWKNKAAKVRFKRAVTLAKKELKSGKKKSK